MYLVQSIYLRPAHVQSIKNELIFQKTHIYTTTAIKQLIIFTDKKQCYK